MINSDYNILKDWMFGKLASLLENTEPNSNYPVLKMSLGEPTLGVPDFTKKILDLEKNESEDILTQKIIDLSLRSTEYNYDNIVKLCVDKHVKKYDNFLKEAT